MEGKLTRTEKIGYGIGNFSNGLILQVISSFLVFYATVILKLPGTVVGVIISISVFWDALSDPLMGYISDVTYLPRWGRRHSYLVIGLLGEGFFNLTLWQMNPGWSFEVRLVFLLMNVLLLKTFITVFMTPYNALAAEMSRDYDERTAIQATKTAFFILGILFSAAGAMFLFFRPTEQYPIGQMNPEAYARLGVTVSVLIVLCSLITVITTWKYTYIPPESIKDKESRGFIELLSRYRQALKNKDYVTVVLGYLLANIGTAIVGTIGLHVFTFTFRMNNTEIGTIMGSLFLASVLSQVFWTAVTKKLDKKRTALVSIGFSVAAGILFLGMVMIRSTIQQFPLLLVGYAILGGIGVGGMLTLPHSMVADTLDEEELRTGKRMEGVYYGGLTFGYKISQSAAIFLLGIIIDLTGFNPELAMQPESTVVQLGVIMAVGSLIAVILSGIAYTRYSINKQKMIRVREELDQKKKIINETV